MTRKGGGRSCGCAELDDCCPHGGGPRADKAEARVKEWEVHPNIEGGIHYTEICECELCERIRELEAEMASESLQLMEQQVRAERAEARVKELETILLPAAKYHKEERIKLRARVEELEERIESLHAEANAREISISNLKAHLQVLEEWIWQLGAVELVSAGAVHDHLGVPYVDVMKELTRRRRKEPLASAFPGGHGE